MQAADIFCLPVLDRYLLYAPRHDFTAMVNRSAVRALRAGLENSAPAPAALQAVLTDLQTPGSPVPDARAGPVTDPLFLGLVTTRGCNMDCRYCDFDTESAGRAEMSIETARAALDAYIEMMRGAGKDRIEIHFFGGEPFFAWDVTFFAVEYAHMRAAELGLEARLEVITNGLVPTSRCQWIASHFDTVVLSLDGPSEIQERHRTARGGGASTRAVMQNAKILAENANELALRACVSAESVGRMVEVAGWMANEFHPTSVCFETLTPSAKSRAYGLERPDPFAFARGFINAARILEPAGIETVLSTAHLGAPQSSFCPVGKDALIVLPDGTVGACYWEEREWRQRGVDLRMGQVGAAGFVLDPQAVQRARALTMQHKDPCADCFCQYHCAGGCHVRRAEAPREGHTRERRVEDVCIQTRLISMARLLQRLGQEGLIDPWLSEKASLEQTALRMNDRLANRELVS